MKNSQIGAIFEKIADILEIEGENPFRIKAYRRAAKAIQDTAKDAADLAKKDELVKLPGIGKDLASKIKEFLKTGKISTYEKLKK
ncbi:MAG: helix-hairpin-helix domain-containing protein, partial [Candidatus Omnitrophota bacterium]|nr:helix-hairpin-helix domain-containing protein [Candidatus Omnitrophota bacterium]